MYVWEVVGFNQVNNTHVNDLGKLTLEKKKHTYPQTEPLMKFYEEFLKRLHVAPWILMSFKY